MCWGCHHSLTPVFRDGHVALVVRCWVVKLLKSSRCAENMYMQKKKQVRIYEAVYDMNVAVSRRQHTTPTAAVGLDGHIVQLSELHYGVTPQCWSPESGISVINVEVARLGCIVHSASLYFKLHYVTQQCCCCASPTTVIYPQATYVKQMARNSCYTNVALGNCFPTW